MKQATKRVISKRIGELLLERKIIDNAKLKEALSLQKKKAQLLGDILMSLGYATERDITEAVTAQFGLPFLPLKNYRIDKKVLRLIPKAIANSYCIMPLEKTNHSLSIALSNPVDTDAIKKVLGTVTSSNVRVYISTAGDIKDSIKQHYN